MTPSTVTVYPRPGVTLYLSGGVHGFTAAMAERAGGVKLRADHAADLATHVVTDAERKAAAAAAESPRAAAPADAAEHAL